MLPENSSQAHLTDSVSVVEIPLHSLEQQDDKRIRTLIEPPVLRQNNNDVVIIGKTLPPEHVEINNLRTIPSRTSNGNRRVSQPNNHQPPPEPSGVGYLAKILLDVCSRYFKIALFLFYNVYLGFGIYRTWHKTNSYGEGIKFLTIITGIAYTFASYYWFLKVWVVKPIYYNLVVPILNIIDSHKLLEKHFSKIVWSLLITGVVVYSFIITGSNRYRLVSGCGVIGFIAFGYLMSEYPHRINWNQVLWGLFLQFFLALFVLRTEFGKQLFKCIGDKITAFLSFTDEGSTFLFGYLVTGKMKGDTIPSEIGIFAFKVLPVILFFSFFVSILYYYGIMQVVVMKAGWFLQVTIGTTPCESINAAANIFLGMTEAPLVIKPYVPNMTKSELFAVMTGGFATIAGAVLAAYINFGVNASHLLSASVMAAPAALGISKLFYPETDESKTQAGNLSIEKGVEQNALEAAGNGASQAIKICSNIAGNLIAFLAFIKFLDTLCIWFGSNVDLEFVSFEWILSKLFIPIALMMGVEWNDCDKVAKMIGLKTLVNEFVAYTELSKQMAAGTLSERSTTIATYALCGFSNFASIGIMLGALGSLVPQRKSDLASIVLKSMIAGSTVTFISASMAGLLIEDNMLSTTAVNNITDPIR